MLHFYRENDARQDRVKCAVYADGNAGNFIYKSLRRMTYLETNFTKFILEKNMQNLNEENMKILLKNTNVDLNKRK